VWVADSVGKAPIWKQKNAVNMWEFPATILLFRSIDPVIRVSML
jgi:hypothetical protein